MLHSINYCMCVFLKFICIYFFLYYRGPCVRKLFTGLIMCLPFQNKEHCIVLYCIVLTTSRKRPASQRLYSTEPKRLKTTSQVVTSQNRKLLCYFNSHNG